mgnify:CR=1 FL=1
MKRVAFAVTYPAERAHPIHRRLMAGGPVSRMDLLAWGPTETVTTLGWYDADRTAVAELLAAVDSVERTRLVAGDGGTYAFVHQTEYELDARVMALVADAPVVFLPPVSFRESGVARVEAVGEQAALGDVHDRLGATLDVRIERVGDFRRFGTPADVTERQAAALSAAVSAGYYDVPRTGSVADVAAQLDCAHSTAGDLLRRAEAAVVEGFVRSRE